MHAFTGWDTVSAFAGKGKAQALMLLEKNTRNQETLTEFGQEWDLPPELMDKLEEFTCCLSSTNLASLSEKNVIHLSLIWSPHKNKLKVIW